MSFGLQVKDSSGNITLGATDRLTRFLYSQRITAGQNGSVTVSGFNAARGGATVTALPGGQAGWFILVPQLSMSGNTVTWTWTNSSMSTYYHDCILLVFMYA